MLYQGNGIILQMQLCRRKVETKNKAKYERSYMTNTLRYLILERDGGRCVLCGRSAKDGVVLNVDHIIPVSKGGKTEPSNLRTLCQQCNLGKSNLIPANYKAG